MRLFDMTPMIDVVLQLIIFFMFTSQLGQLQRTEVDLPEEVGEQESDSESADFIIDMDRRGVFRMESEVIERTELVRLIARQAERVGSGDGIEILIRPDREASARHLNLLATELAEVGIRRWKLGTSVPPGGAR